MLRFLVLLACLAGCGRGASWTPEQIERLAELHQQGRASKDISAHLEALFEVPRSPQAVRQEIYRLKLILSDLVGKEKNTSDRQEPPSTPNRIEELLLNPNGSFVPQRAERPNRTERASEILELSNPPEPLEPEPFVE